MDFLTENIGTLVVLAVVAIIIGLIINKIIKDKKDGKSGCGCGCDGCAMKGQCHTQKK